MGSIFEDSQILDDLIVGYCLIFASEDTLIMSPEWDDYQDTNDSYFSEAEASRGYDLACAHGGASEDCGDCAGKGW